MNDFDRDEAIDLLFEMKMNVSSIHWAGGFTGADGVKFVDAVDDGIGAVQLAAQTGADCLIVHPGAQNGHTDRHARRIFRSAIDNLAQAASDFGTRIAIEPMPNPAMSSWTFYRHFEEYLEMIEAFDPKHVGLVLDLFHIGDLEEVRDRIPQFIDRVALVQLADRDTSVPHVGVSKGGHVEYRRVPGDGDLQIDRWVDELNRNGYRGAYELEVHGKGFSRSNYRATIDKSIRYLCSSGRSFNRHISDAEKKRALHKRSERQKPVLNMQTRW
jgi:sugar phosphate isomerase/epimerase